MVVGLIAPTIVVPTRLLDPNASAALACVLRHEAAHLRRRDAWLSWLMQCALVVAWPVIPLWIATARVRHLMELACDEAALSGATADERRRYGHTLLDIAEQELTTAPAAALSFGSTLRARIEALASQAQWPRAIQTSLVAMLVATFAACSAISPSPSAAPSAVSGSPESQPAAAASAKLQSVDDLVKLCPHFVAFKGRPDTDEWMRRPTDGIPQDEVTACRKPEVVVFLARQIWAAEARNNIGQIARDNVDAYKRDGKLCPSGAPIPAELPVPGTKYQSTKEEWNGPGWGCLHFMIIDPMFFQLRYETSGPELTITAHAIFPGGDGRSTDATFVIRGHAHGGDLDIAPSIEETWKDLP
jgi:hypothetical protein